MPQNLELKAAVSSVTQTERIAERLRARHRGTFLQKDTYFNLLGGRLKLRETPGMLSELIWYVRPERLPGRYSDYQITKVRKSGEIRRALNAILGTKTVVKKRRAVYLYKNARIHIDRVSGLGGFVEFEVIVRKGKSQAGRLMTFLIRTFGVRKSDRIRWSYSDLLLRTRKRSRR